MTPGVLGPPAGRSAAVRSIDPYRVLPELLRLVPRVTCGAKPGPREVGSPGVLGSAAGCF